MAASSTISGSHVTNITFLLLILGLLILFLAGRYILTNRTDIVAQLPSYLRKIVDNALSGRIGLRDENAAASPGALYYKTAVQLGALVAACNDQSGTQELFALKRAFKQIESKFPTVDEVYYEQLDRVLNMDQIIEPFVDKYGASAQLSESIVFGMCAVGMADAHMTDRELGLIRISADALGLTPGATSRLLMTAGYFGANRASEHDSQSTQSATHSTPQSERFGHLQTLGLTPGVDPHQIKDAWRRLARRFHPDKLVSQNLPPDQLEKAEARMQSINEAYDWLKMRDQ